MTRHLSLFWFRRDLRIDDNIGLTKALESKTMTRPVFIFDSNILDDLKNRRDRRVAFIFHQIEYLRTTFQKQGSDLWTYFGDPVQIFDELLQREPIRNVFTNEDFEPYGMQRDATVKALCERYGVHFYSFTDHVVFHPNAILKSDQTPYQVYTAYKNKWLATLTKDAISTSTTSDLLHKLEPSTPDVPQLTLSRLGFEPVTDIDPQPVIPQNIIADYDATRDFPAIQGTSQLGIHLRFGTISIRKLIQFALDLNETFLSELIWREFFMMILYHFPHTVSSAFKPAYDNINWRNAPNDFNAWCKGETGYPLVDAGMQQLNQTGYIHNRVRMVTASFLCKHLLIDWRWGEAYFAEKLNDFELASNVGNWQWAAGSGCDAAPYFRVFNPTLQQKKFDPKGTYVNTWNHNQHLLPLVEHKFAVERCLNAYKAALNKV